jgi:hypothetical protein
LSLFLVALSIYYYLTRIREREDIAHSGFFVLGVLLGLSIFARIDSVFLLLAITIDFCLRSWKKLREAGVKSLLGKLAGVYLSAFFILLPWWIFQIMYFKTLVPVSGEAVRFQALAFGDHNLTFAFFKDKFIWSLTQWNNSPFPFYHVSLFSSVPELLILICVSVGLFVVLITRKRITKTISPLNFLWIFCLGLLLFYSLYVPAFWFFKRYYYPVIFVLILYWGILLDMIISLKIPKFKLYKPMLSLALVIACGWLFYPGLRDFLFSKPESPSRCDIDSCSGYYKVALWVKEHVERGERIGSYQSGALGYFLEDNTVINLDGVVNRDAFDALKNNDSFGYVKSENIAFITDWKLNIRKLLIAHSPKTITPQDLLLIGVGPPQEEKAYHLFEVRK